ncbi:hypothetical protein [Vibrio sp. JZG120]
MLKDTIYLGHTLYNANFEMLIEEPTGNGFFKYNVSLEPDIEITEITTETDSKHKLIRLNASTKAYGFLGDESNPEEYEEVYRLKLRFCINFEHSNDKASIETLVDENQWFFENYAFMASKEIASSIIKHNPVLVNTYFPPHRTPD